MKERIHYQDPEEYIFNREELEENFGEKICYSEERT